MFFEDYSRAYSNRVCGITANYVLCVARSLGEPTPTPTPNPVCCSSASSPQLSVPAACLAYSILYSVPCWGALGCTESKKQKTRKQERKRNEEEKAFIDLFAFVCLLDHREGVKGCAGPFPLQAIYSEKCSHPINPSICSF